MRIPADADPGGGGEARDPLSERILDPPPVPAHPPFVGDDHDRSPRASRADRPARGSRPSSGASRPPILRGVKLVVAIVHNEDAGVLVDALLENEYRATRLHSSGGFLKQTNATILLGVEDEQVEDVLGIVRDSCHSRSQVINPMPPIMEPGEFFMPYPLEVEVGGATVFVVPVERVERL